MPEYQPIDKRIYNGADPAYPPIGQPADNQDPAVVHSNVPIGKVLEGSPMLQQGQAVVNAANRPTASMLESAGAAVSQWSVGHAYDYFTMPHFESTNGAFSSAAALKTVPFQLDMDQEQFLLKSGDRRDEFHYKLNHLQDRMDAQQAMGDNSLSSMVGMLFDPGYIAISTASLGSGNLARLAGATARGQRLAAGGAAAATTYGLGKAEQQIVPVSETQVVASAMFFGATEGMLYRGGKLVPVDPAAPTQRLQVLAEELSQGGRPAPLDPAHPSFVGEVGAGDNLTRPRIQPTGEGSTPVQYKGGSSGGEYIPAVNLSREEQAAMHADGVVHVDTVADIAQHAPSVRRGLTEIDADAKAVYLPAEDKVFLVRANIKAGDDVKGILLHEVGVHMNAERVLGVERMGQMMTKLEDLAASGNARAKAAFEAVPKNTPLHLIREEALGYYVEANHKLFGDSIVSRFVHGVKETLRRVGLQGLKLTENDIVQLVRKAAAGKKSASFDTAFPYAWHGSPVRGIDQLDTAYMGSGEGAQAFGHGHYLTSEKGTALSYRNKEALRRGINPEDAGLYRVKINAQEHQFIDLDGRAQSATVQAAFEKLGVRPGVTGKTAYDYLAKTLGGQKAASEALHAEGVAGNKYATGRTRSGGDKSSNYVVFHNDAVDMAARYSKGASPAAKAVASKLSVSLHKSLSSFSAEAKKTADLLVDNPLESGGNSVANQQRAIRADMATLQFQFEDAVYSAMAEQGFGTLKQITHTREAIAVQRQIEKDVFVEVERRRQLAATGQAIDRTAVPAHVNDIAEKWNDSMKAALAERKRSGELGAQSVPDAEWYAPRKWDNVRIEGVTQKLVDSGMPLDNVWSAPFGTAGRTITTMGARQVVADALAIGIQRSTGMDSQLAKDVADATLARARRKGYFEDSVRGQASADTIAEVRDILEHTNIPVARREKVLEIMTGKADEAGKSASLKHRMSVSLDEPIGTTGHTLVDLLDTSMVSMGERYLDSASASAAFARKGLVQQSDITALRKATLESITDQTARGEAAKLFDNTIAALSGAPVGEEMNKFMRMSKGLTQMLGLARAGLFQLTEYATLMADHGTLSVMSEMFRELPFVRGMLSDPMEAGHLRNVLARNSSEDIRIRPFLSKMEDNFAIPMTDTAQLAIQQAKQLVPYLNGLKYVQGHQARVAANCMVNVFERAAKGEIKALAALEHYGLESHIMSQISSDIAAHGMDTVKWAPSTWDAVRAPLTKMMDDAVLRARTGEIPAFAQFSTTGKFIFTFRSFVLGAHNKVLAGTLNQKGFSGLGLVLMHQLPLTYMIAQASNTMTGKPPLTDKQAIGQALGQAGALGLLSEAIGVAFGDKQQFGAPGFIAADRVYKLGAAAAKGDLSATGAAAYNAIPLLSVIPVLKSIPEAINPTHVKKQ